MQIFKTMDGNSAAAYISYAFTDVAFIYPITPSSPMAEQVERYSSKGIKNIFGNVVQVSQMQSEGGVAGALHGSATVGGLTSTYTSSQGLLLMIPNMYKIAGELLPTVIHVASRTVAKHALSIFGDHSDVYACRQTGFAMLCANNPQEVMDLSVIAHLSTIKGRIPFLHFFDGFRTSHEIQKIRVWNYDELAEMIDSEALDNFRQNSLNPANNFVRGTAQNDDVFFQNAESNNKFYQEIIDITDKYMQSVNRKVCTNYQLFNYYGDETATEVIVAMGSVCDTIEETIDYLNRHGRKVGLVKVRLYRPFSTKHFINVLPKSVKKISVLDRSKEAGAIGEPLYLDVLGALNEHDITNITVFAGRYGLSSKNTTPGQIIAIYNNMLQNNSKKHFTIGINDDVTNLSLAYDDSIDTTPKDIMSCKFWGFGSDGTISANKNSIKILGDNTDMQVQGYFAYDSKKSGGLTVSHLRFGHEKIKSTYYINKADFVACHNPSYIGKYDMISDLKYGGSFLLNCGWNIQEISEKLSDEEKQYIYKNKIKVYVIDATKISLEIGLAKRINTILQAAFFKIVNIIPLDDAVKFMKQAAKNTYAKKELSITEKNYLAIDRGISELQHIKIPDSWANFSDDTSLSKIHTRKSVINTIFESMNRYKGNEIPVSAFVDYADGHIPLGTSKFEKRMTATKVPHWIKENCIQCNLCSLVCPHAVIRPVVMDETQTKNAPKSMEYIKIFGMPKFNFSMTVSVKDCTECENCIVVCPGKKGNKALEMRDIESQLEFQSAFDYGTSITDKKEISEKFRIDTIKGSQFRTPLLEFSGACAGCGETPYAKLVTQLFGEHMYIANATGCSSIWGASYPSIPYSSIHSKGPAWHNSLFEDNAEFGYGMLLGYEAIRSQLKNYILDIQKYTNDVLLKNLCDKYLKSYGNTLENYLHANNLIKKFNSMMLSEKKSSKLSDMIVKVNANIKYLAKKSIWVFGGDGWAYDIGFGGLDHVVAMNKNINILIFDTEVYSNTGGQCSKSTPRGAVTKFASNGKSLPKKNLAKMLMSYGYVYVAQIAIGADYNQCIKTLIEAEAYNGPSVIIAYSPCINHGLKFGMKNSPNEEKLAVSSGYWNLFRFNPMLKFQNRSPLIFDSPVLHDSLFDFTSNERRYTSLINCSPDRNKLLLSQLMEDSKMNFDGLLNLSNIDSKK